MEYREFSPDSMFTHHVECFWELDLNPEEVNRHYEVWAPDCTFDMMFSRYPVCLKFTNERTWQVVAAGASFVGQKTSGLKLLVKQRQKVFGIRFKPFAFAHLFPLSPGQLNNRAMALDQLFELKKSDRELIRYILGAPSLENQRIHCESLVTSLLNSKFYVDQTFRAQLNYIMERKGALKIRELFSEFGISKVTLRKHFLEKMGLSPKKVSRIWRLNHFLELKRKASNHNLTILALESGYYDQAHFIREFKSFFHYCPTQLFQNESQLLGISQDIISRRFSNQYDPVMITP